MGQDAGRGALPFLVPGWVDSDGERAALARAPCGCALREEAEAAPTAHERAMLGEQAAAAQAAWGCPDDGEPLPGPDAAPDLDPDHREALEAYGRMTGAAGFVTCPRRYARLPWVLDATQARACKRDGCFEVCWPAASAVLLEATHLVAVGVRARERYDDDARQRELDEMTRQNARNRPPR